MAMMLCMGITACYKDKGNYDYTPLPEIKVEELADDYSVTQFDTLVIHPQVEEQGLDLTYSWEVYSNAVSNTRRIHISDEKDLNYVVNEIPGSYTLVFTVTNRQNDVKTYQMMGLKIQGVITDGWMVLQEKNDGKTDFDILISPFFTNKATKDSHFKDMYESINGEPLEGGRGVKISSFFTGAYQYVYVLTEQAGVRLSAINMQRMSDLSSMVLDGKPLHPEGYTYLPYGTMNYFAELLVSDGRFYMSSYNQNTFTEPVTRDGLTYRASPYAPRWIPWVVRAVLYDEEHGRFLMAVNNVTTLQQMTAAPGALFDWNNMHAHLVYLESGFNKYEYAVMEDWTTHQRSVYAINFLADGAAYAVAKYDTKNCPEFDVADCFAIGSRGNVFYYSHEHTVYLYDYSGSNSAKSIMTYPDDEVITHLELQKPNEGFYMKNHPYDNKVLTVVTYSEQKREGKVYMYYVNEANGSIDRSSEKIWDGFGRIIDMEFNYGKYGS